MNLSSEFWDLVALYEANLIKFNQIHNLTNYKSIKSVAIDSVEMLENLAKFIQSNTPNLIKSNQSNLNNFNTVNQLNLSQIPLFDKIKICIDVGSGAGFPAIFLSFVLKDCEFHLFEPIMKKASFLSFVKINLNLKNIIIHPQKIQNSPKFKANLITSRAVMKADDLIQICSGFYDESSIFALYKGQNALNEISNINATKQISHAKNRNYVFIKDIK